MSSLPFYLLRFALLGLNHKLLSLKDHSEDLDHDRLGFVHLPCSNQDLQTVFRGDLFLQVFFTCQARILQLQFKPLRSQHEESHEGTQSLQCNEEDVAEMFLLDAIFAMQLPLQDVGMVFTLKLGEQTSRTLVVKEERS